jgi:hypothetical protein
MADDARSQRRPEAPTREPLTGPPYERGAYTERHPAYAQISAARVSGTAYLYGSDFVHHHYVTLKIARSERLRALHDWYHAREDYIEVALSEAQWATFVSSLNVGEGAPCTLAYLQDHYPPTIPAPAPKHAQFKDDLLARYTVALGRLSALRAQIESGKGGKVQALRDLDKAIQEIQANAPYVAQAFGEHLEQEVEKAKTEIHAYAVRVGVAAQAPALPEADSAAALSEKTS